MGLLKNKSLVQNTKDVGAIIDTKRLNIKQN